MDVDKLVEECKSPITTALCKQYTSYAGIDTNVMIDGKYEGKIQAISYCRTKVDGQWVVQGSIILLCLDDGCGNLPDKMGHIQIVCANEYGQSAIAWEVKDVEIISSSSGTSIDDMVTEEHYVFQAKEFIPGRKLATKDWAKAVWALPIHVKPLTTEDSSETKALVAEAITHTAEEPLGFPAELTQLLSKYKVIL